MILSQGRRKWCRWRRLGILVVVLMSVMNIAFLTDLLLNHVASVHKDTSTVPNPEGDETKKFIELTLTSSKEKASVIVDGKAVMLRSVLAAHGSNSSMCTVFVDGFFQEPAAVAELLGVRAIHHEPKSERNGRISQHVKSTLHDAFELFPNAQYSIIIEEDLDVSLDFFKYFSQTIGLMAQDESIYCISAWNDQGYRHSCEDPSLLYRVETMPGLGWVMKRKLFKEELEPIWPGPDKVPLWDWDMWMRVDGIRKDRECIIPDISRTYHFGAAGLNMNPYFQEHYFNKHKLNTDVAVKLRDVEQLKKEEYEMVIHQLFVNAIVLDHTKNPCSEDFVPKEKDKIFVFYFFMEHAKHFDHWMKLAKCFNLWDLDARGFHKGLWRFWLHGNHILSVGSPYSPYSKKYKPLDLEPLQLT